MFAIISATILRLKNKIDEDIMLFAWIMGVLELCMEITMILILMGKL